MRFVRGIVLSVGMATFVLMVFIIALFLGAVPLHNITLSRMKQALVSSVSHPPDSQLVTQRTAIGSTYIDSEECNYFSAQLRKSPLSPEDIVQAYRGAAVSLFGFAHRMPVRVVMYKERESLPLGHPAELLLYDSPALLPSNRRDTLYVVYLLEEKRLWFGDYRCYESTLQENTKVLL
ncbi:hypothetical protein HY732_04050 [Candidatus Uhrbacteria bacterium]|nr:hypothetical protein [Candidatus Uhrbacteria bacterium]